MSYVLTHFWPGGTEDQYRRTVAAAHPRDGLPEGQIYHAAGPTEGGLLIVTLWASKEHSDHFYSETSIATTPVAGGLVGPPEQRAAEVVNLLMA
ncbi:MAG: hypothetical protein ABSG43_18070 [Solirubrobacteraceae bacterium]|jgi:hypothetical protein